jgi:hypothetical protein
MGKFSFIPAAFTFIIILVMLPISAFAQANVDETRNFGLGLMLGEPTGVSVKSWLGQKSAFDIGAAWSLSGRNEALHMHADYLYHRWFEDRENLAFYYGLGGRIIFSDNAMAGIRIPFGLTYVFDSVPFDLFVEAVPILDLSPDVEFAGNGAVGIRYYF